MSSYRVSVFKNLLSSDGHPFKCLQFAIDIASAKSAQRAIEAARWQYLRKVRTPAWNSIADIVEAQDTDIPVPAWPRVEPKSTQYHHRRKATSRRTHHRLHASRTLKLTAEAI